MKAADLINVDIAFLLSCAMALALTYWIPPAPDRNYFRWVISHMPLLLGAYVIALKIPRLLGGAVNYRLMSAVLLLTYIVLCWFIVWAHRRHKCKSTPDLVNNNH